MLPPEYLATKAKPECGHGSLNWKVAVELSGKIWQNLKFQAPNFKVSGFRSQK
jgi:hypothetical protein